MPFKKKPLVYDVWRSMRDRCYNPRSRAFPDYGGRGIQVCDRWRNSYAAFAEDMGERPEGCSIDRVDNDGDYTPTNCRWTDRKTQQRNRRNVVHVTVDGIRYRAIDLADASGLKTDTIVKRANLGLCFEDVIAPDKRVYHAGLALGGQASGQKRRSATHCAKGHEFTEANTHITPQGWRRCRACHNAKMRRLNAAKNL